MKTYLLFRNVNNGRIECNMYNINDAPLYVEQIKSGPNKGLYVDIFSNRVTSIPESIIKYAPIVNDELQIITYFNGNCDPVKPKKPLYYDAMYNL